MSTTQRSTGVGRRFLDRLSITGTVIEIEAITPRMRRVRIGGDAVRGLGRVPGQQVRVHVGDLLSPRMWIRPGDLLRTYSVWWYDPAAGELDLCVMDHGEGPGARWGRDLTVGQEVRFGRPEGRFTLRPDAPYHVFAGEETAAVAIGAMLAALPADAAVYGAVETATPEDRLPLARGAELVLPLRGAASAASSAVLLDAVRGLELPTEPGIAYVAGEAKTVQSIREHLVVDRGWPRRSVLTKPFWTPGKKGME
ncbi:siderophore-interacting protein [Embleya hyalina]|uniref:Siderophore-interacting protein n=1 Tax=Embleya hyalina TaxID=516124 RepID=A0A401YTK9_9ACTN|nr:siderophore-interacting protein [Embleya hyalina]GCD97909.1 siderophore-interacting protein [Embleya hyalina]